ncbi:hypothetical protein PAHAL_2G228100 [Panicum hallii]|uniref:Uncharacterized protein n=1 Tax=Panicum hallii TaxID=206008 RepID=A0A2T8KQ18_9POAL|nr:hypothetical protein PAHAL_2G228100 [Panicum hallii]
MREGERTGGSLSQAKQFLSMQELDLKPFVVFLTLRLLLTERSLQGLGAQQSRLGGTLLRNREDHTAFIRGEKI